MGEEQEQAERRAAFRAQMKEDEWNHPRLTEDSDVLTACSDSRCRFCKDRDGEVRNGFG